VNPVEAAHQIITDLGQWHMVGRMATVIQEAVDHEGGPENLDDDALERLTTMNEWQRLEEWGQRWALLTEELRTFYRQWAPHHKTASVALHHTLVGIPNLSEWQTAVLSQLWEEQFLSPPSIDLAPRVAL